MTYLVQLEMPNAVYHILVSYPILVHLIVAVPNELSKQQFG